LDEPIHLPLIRAAGDFLSLKIYLDFCPPLLDAFIFRRPKTALLLKKDSLLTNTVSIQPFTFIYVTYSNITI